MTVRTVEAWAARTRPRPSRRGVLPVRRPVARRPNHRKTARRPNRKTTTAKRSGRPN